MEDILGSIANSPQIASALAAVQPEATPTLAELRHGSKYVALHQDSAGLSSNATSGASSATDVLVLQPEIADFCEIVLDSALIGLLEGTVC